MIGWHFDILPGEHIYSCLGRYFWLCGMLRPEQFLQKFNLSEQYLKPQLAYNQDVAKVIKNFLKPLLSTNAIESHVPSCAWSLIIDKSLYCKLNEKLIKGSIKSNLHKADQHSINFNRSWRACDECIKENISKFGISYWHMQHQLPGTIFCHQHKTILRTPELPAPFLRELLLPHQIFDWNDVVINPDNSIVDWGKFVDSVYSHLVKDPLFAYDLKHVFFDIIVKPSKISKKYWIKKQEIIFEDKLGDKLLNLLFSNYSVTSNKNKENILASTLSTTNGNSSGFKNPIYWLALLYWQKDELLKRGYDLHGKTPYII